MSRLVPFGKFYKPFGVRGEIRFGAYIDGITPASLKAGFLVRPDEQPSQNRVVEFTSAKKHSRGWVVHPKGFSSPESVAILNGSELYLDRSSLPPATSKNYYHFDIEGADVFDEAGKLLGVIQVVIETGANSVWQVAKVGGGELLIPVIEPVVLNIDIDAGRVTVRLMEGLDEL